MVDKIRPSDYFTRFVIFATFFVAIQFVPMMLVLIKRTAMNQIGLRSLYALIFILGYIAVIVICARVIKKMMHGPIWHHLRLRDIKYLVLAFVSFIVAEIVLNILNQKLFGQTQTANNQAISNLLSSDRWIFYLLMFSGIVLSPIVEELIFRGYLINGFFYHNQFWAPVVVSGVVFSLAHLSTNIVSFLIYAVLGMLLAGIYKKTDNIATSIGLHMLNNLMAMSMMATMIH